MDKVSIIGAGITGLTAGWELKKRNIDFTIYESSNKVGGKISTSKVGDIHVDEAADSFLARSQDAINLCKEIGLSNQLVSPKAKRPPLIYKKGELFRLPSHTVLGAPTSKEELHKSGLISNESIHKIDPEYKINSDINLDTATVGLVCRQEYGNEIVDYLINPLIGGINASDVDKLSLLSCTPQFYYALKEYGSLYEGLKKLLNKSNEPVFYSFKNGPYELISKLNHLLGDHIVYSPVTAENIDLKSPQIITCPAYSASEIFKNYPAVSNLLYKIQYASIAQITIESSATIPSNMVGSPGILFPHTEDKLLSACTFLSSKWDHYAKDETQIIRLTCGRYEKDSFSQDLGEEELTERLLSELYETTKIELNPIHTRIKRWPTSIPQYLIGHKNLVDSIRQESKQTGSFFAGAAYDGIGITSCISSAIKAVNELVENEI